MKDSCFISYVDTDSVFYIKILERGFIKDVCLLICPNIYEAFQTHSFDSIHIEKAKFSDRRVIHNNVYYSEFACFICFPKPISYMEYCFFYSFNGKDYLTEPQKFEIRNY